MFSNIKMRTASFNKLGVTAGIIIAVMLILGMLPAVVSAVTNSSKNALSSSKKQAYLSKQVIVKFKPDQDRQTLAGSENADKAEILKNRLKLRTVKKFKSSSAELLELSAGSSVEQIIKELKQDTNVLYAQPNFIYYPEMIVNDPGFGQLWGLKDINAPLAWDLTTGSTDVVVAVLDTGIDINHPDLAANIWRNPGEIANNGLDDDHNGRVDDVNGWDFWNNDNTVYNPEDNDIHGTHVAGTIAAIANNQLGVVGVAPKVKIMPLKFIGPEGGYTSGAIEALEYAAQQGIKISNNSWGRRESPYEDQALLEAINNSGQLFVAAAGNDASDNDQVPHVPANLDSPNIISVAAVDSQGELAPFSNYGAATVDIAAPGVNILSTVPRDVNPGYPYEYKSGTSMAAPHVAGTAALMLSANTELSPGQMKEIIMGNVTTLESIVMQTVSGGMVNSEQAVRSVNSLMVSGHYPENDAVGIPTDQVITVKFNRPIVEGINFTEIMLLKDYAELVPCQAAIEGSLLTITPAAPLEPNTYYAVILPPETVQDEQGNTQQFEYTFGFTTQDNRPLAAVSSNPQNGAADVSKSPVITVSFNKEIHEGEFFNNIRLVDANNNQAGIIASTNGQELTIKPLSTLQSGTVYTVTVPKGSITDSWKAPLAEDYSFSFTTANTLDIPGKVTDAVFDPANPILYLLCQDSKQLFALNYETGDRSVMDFVYTPERLEMGVGQYSDELYVSLLYGPHRYYIENNEQSGAIAVIDKENFTLRETLELQVDPYDIAAGRDGYLYITSGSDQLTDFVAYNRATKAESDRTKIRYMSFAQLHAQFERVYTINTDVSPRDYRAYNISGGKFTDPKYPGGYDSPYHGEYPLDIYFMLDPAGRFIFNGSGVVFSTAADKSSDMRYVAALPAGFKSIAFATDRGQLYTVPKGEGGYLNVYTQHESEDGSGAVSFISEENIPISGQGKYVFQKDGKLIVVMEQGADGDTDIQVVNLPDRTPPAVTVTNPTAGAVNVPLTQDIVVKFSELVQQGDAYQQISLTDSAGNDVDKQLVLSETNSTAQKRSLLPLSVLPQGNTLVIHPVSPLAPNTEYQVYIPADAVVNANGQILAGDYSFSFTTQQTAVVEPVKVISVITDQSSPQVKNTTIKVTAAATGGSGQYLYKFWVHDGSAWKVVQAYSSDNTYFWTPATAGNYQISVYVKDLQSTKEVDSYKVIKFQVVEPSEPVVLNGVTPDKASPQAIQNLPVTFTASASGGGGQLLYQFWVNDGSGWKVVQPYSTANTFTWQPAAPGKYQISTYVKAQNSIKPVDAYKIISYQVLEQPLTPVVLNKVTADKKSPQALQNVPITFTAEASGGSGQLLYQFWVNDGSGWKVIQSYSADNKFVWTPAAPGDYLISTYVKDANSGKAVDAYKIVNFKVLP